MIIVTAYLLDQLLGDPEKWPHPVRLIGKMIQMFEKILYPKKTQLKNTLLLRGFLLTVLVLMGTTLIIIGFQKIFASLHWILGLVFSIYLAYTTLAVKNLQQASVEIYNYLEKDDLIRARKSLSMIVGRETDNLDESEVTRAVIETVAENFSDGVVAPLLYLFLGGPLLATIYKAINTMDSMIGYKNQRYLYFGRFAARLDDLVNIIPARISTLFLVIAAFVNDLNWKQAWKMMLRDRKQHSSPNAGYPESAVAGALETQLGGDNIYFGKRISKPTMGDQIRAIERGMILETIKLMNVASFMIVMIMTAFLIWIGGFEWNTAVIF